MGIKNVPFEKRDGPTRPKPPCSDVFHLDLRAGGLDLRAIPIVGRVPAAGINAPGFLDSSRIDAISSDHNLRPETGHGRA
jgi:hypothetical protein